ncbi:MAG: hypothetical protein M0027_05135, partial [Candidatus Dormibacteraeota bacterium]|nr:hypothetical protein [Candidatus Dormibacteraeota bacterium]
ANLATVPVSSTGMISFHSYLYNQAAGGSVQVIFDVQGYYSSAIANGSGLYVPLANPYRIADTRSGQGQPDSGSPLGPNSVTALSVVGSDGVPTNATAVVVNLTEASATADGGYITAYPAGATQPTASNINFNAGAQVANRVTVGVGTNGQIDLYNFNGTTNVVVDVDGYYTASGATSGSAFYAVTPQRIADTRAGVGGTPIPATGTESFQITGNGGIPAESSATPITAVAANVTAASTTANGYLTIYPAGQSQPTASDVNWTGPGENVPNFAIMGALSDAASNNGAVEMYNGSGGSTSILIDVFGYFAAPNSTFFSVTPATTSVTAGSTSADAITATEYSSGTGVTSDQVMFSASGASCGGFGSSSSPTLTTFATLTNGTATVDYYASASGTGSCTITAQAASDAATATTIINQVATAVTVGTAATYTAGTGNQAFPITVDNSSGQAVSGASITFTGTSGTASWCAVGSFTATSTNSSGVATAIFTNQATGNAGYCTVTANASWTVSGTTFTASGSATFDLKSGATTNLPYEVFVSPSPSLVAGGGTSTITVTVDNSAGNAVIPNDAVQLSLSGAACGTITGTNPAATSATTGVATFTYTAPASGPAGVCTVTATEAATGATGSSVNNTLGAELFSGTAYTSITLGSALGTGLGSGSTLVLYNGLNTPVTVTTSASAAAGATTLSINSFTPANNYPATDVVAGLFQEAQAAPDTITISANPTTLTKGGAASQITVTDSNTAVSTIYLWCSANGGTPVACTPASIAMTNGSGSAYYDSGSTSEFVTITANESSTSGTASPSASVTIDIAQ